jgi:F420-dependent oxidoreductase-like protein
VGQIVAAEQAGFQSVWIPNIFAADAMTLAALGGRATAKLEIGTAVVPTHSRHPLYLAQQALTTQAASRGRFSLGIGLSHKLVIENMFGMSYDKPARHMKEYLEVLGPFLRGEGVQYQGEQYKVAAQFQVPGATRVPLLVAALGPVMLKLTGRLADGTITWMTGPKTLSAHIIPTLREAAKEAGKPEPRIVAGFPVLATNNPAEAREKIGKALVIYGQLPSYRAMLDREGAAGPADIALAGDEKYLRGELARLREIGVTDFDAAITPVEDGGYERTLSFLQTELGK